MFSFFKKKKPTSVLDELIFAVYGYPPPPKTAKLDEAIQIAHDELLMGMVNREEVAKLAAELNALPTPYSTHDLALSVAQNFFMRQDLMTRLRDAQVVARLKTVDWLSQKIVAPLLVKNFENVLYKLYKPGS